MEIGHTGKRILGFALALSMVLNGGVMTAQAKPAWPSDMGIMAEAGIVMDANTGAVLFGQNIHVAYAPASITKLLTALVVAEHTDLDEMVTFSHAAVYDVESGSGNALALDEGDVLSVRDCLHALLLRSSNQAANALAEHVGGSRDGFVEMMNQKIGELGCGESHFANPSGLNSTEQYVTAYDMAIIARAAFQNETVLEVASTRNYTIPPTKNNPAGLTIAVEHRLLRTTDTSSQYYLEGATAGKTGYTSVAGNTLVTYAVRNGRGMISVVLKGSQPQYYLDGKNLIDYGYAAFQDVPVYDKESFLQEQESFEMSGTSYPADELYLSQQEYISLPNGAEFADAERTFSAEVPAGSPSMAVGMLKYTYDDRQVGTAYIYTKQLRVRVDGEVGDPLVEASAGDSKPVVIQAISENWPLAIGMILFLAAVCLIVFFVWYRQRQIQIERARRRARQRQRLRELGYSQQEFDRMLEERNRNYRKSGGGSRRRR